MDPPTPAVVEAVRLALAEDLLPLGDLTAVLLPKGAVASAEIVSRQLGVLAGSACVNEAYAQVDPTVVVDWHVGDGAQLAPGTVVASIGGRLASLVSGERTALNFLCHLSGVATLTAKFVAEARQASGGFTRVLDTRKTTPGLRALEKAAVRAGGGHNHRVSLSDAVMIKDNHLGRLTIADAVARARRLWPGKPVYVECDTLDQLAAIVVAEADRAMLDNMTPEQIAAAVARWGGRVELEVTGGVTLATVAAFAAARPDFISVGALTHSAGVVDLGLDVSPDALTGA